MNFEEYLSNVFGFRFVVHFEDTMVFLAGIFIGMILMSCLSGRVVFKLQKVSNLGSSNVKLIKFVHDGNYNYIADPKNIGESIETLLLVIFRPLFQVKEYSYRDERRTERFLIIMFIIGVIIFILAFLSISTVLVDHLPIPSK
ncbi:hypothetical protein ACN077_20895 [Clostridium chromiireducens]|uniref:hypothetical protein n=1 Tax=Clostridium chromiireducens TaxID=225345 RepID=UPI003AF9D55E